MITSEWPTEEHPVHVPFLVQRIGWLRRAGVEVTVFSFRGNKNPVNYAKAWYRLRKSYSPKRADFDLVDAQFGQSGLIALPLSVPLVVTYHGSDLLGYVGKNGRLTSSGRLLQHISRFVAGRAAERIVVAQHLADRLPSQLPSTVIPCGVDMELFKQHPKEESRRRLGLPLNQPLVLFAANPMNPIKRFSLAQEAVAKLPSSLQARLVTIIDVDHEEVPDYMSACDTLLLTSIHEGSPTVIKEALACNLPVVTVDVGDVRERLLGVEGCIICDDDRPETIAEGVQVVLQKGKRVDGRGAVQDLDIRITTQRIIEVYQRTLANH